MKIFFVLVTIMISFTLLTGCSSTNLMLHESIYDNNNKIAEEGDSYSTLLWKGSLMDKIHIQKHNGAKSMLYFSVPAEGGDFYIEYDITVTEGDFKLVLVHYSENGTLIVEGNGTGEQLFHLDQGEYALKAVGRNATAQMTIRVKSDDTISAKISNGLFEENETIILDPLH